MRSCWVVTPDEDFAVLAAAITDARYTLVRESEIVPEFRSFQKLNGWFKQQAIKIAIARLIKTKFYLTLDADLVCWKMLRHSDLVRHNRAGCYIQPSDLHPEWYKSSERVLRLPRSGACHGVTPAVLSRKCMLMMQKHLSHLAEHNLLVTEWLDCHRSLSPQASRSTKATDSRPWVVYLLMNTPWTEYSLYYTFLEATEKFDAHHFRTEHCLYSTNSLWHANQVSSWDPHGRPARDDHSFFLVVQSNSGVASGYAREKLARYLDI